MYIGVGSGGSRGGPFPPNFQNWGKRVSFCPPPPQKKKLKQKVMNISEEIIVIITKDKR